MKITAQSSMISMMMMMEMTTTSVTMMTIMMIWFVKAMMMASIFEVRLAMTTKAVNKWPEPEAEESRGRSWLRL